MNPIVLLTKLGKKVWELGKKVPSIVYIILISLIFIISFLRAVELYF